MCAVFAVRAAGDTLFALGCGKLFEGDPPMMWASLSKLTQLPRDTLVYCAHEYTQSNARFAVHIDPNNATLAKRKQAIDDARSKVSCLVLLVFLLCIFDRERGREWHPRV